MYSFTALLILLSFNYYLVNSELLLRLYPESLTHLEVLDSLQNFEGILPIDFWRAAKKLNDTADLMISNSYQLAFEKYLDEIEMKHDVQIKDVEKLIKKERYKIRKANRRRRRRSTSHFYFYSYQPYRKMKSYMMSLARDYPSICRIVTIGTTHENRPILLAKVGNGNNGRKPAIWIDGSIHAREWVSPHVAIYILSQLVTKYGTDPVITRLVDKLDWYIAPNLNPDGYIYSWTSTSPKVRFWRKNRAPNQCIEYLRTEYCCVGVDLNRNFDSRWGEIGRTQNPCKSLFRGEYAFSEPESKAVRDFVWPRYDQIKAFLTLHSYSQLWIHSWGYQRRYYPEDVQDLRAVARKATAAVKAKYGKVYRVGSGSDLFCKDFSSVAMLPFTASSSDAASGSSVDWAKEIGIKYAYNLELRPTPGHDMHGFMLDANEILPTAEETFEGVKVVADAVISEFGN